MVGKYRDEVVLVVGDDLRNLSEKLEKLSLKIRVKYYPDIVKSRKIENSETISHENKINNRKEFQYQKLFLFHTWFREWNQVLYIDAGMRIFNPIESIFELEANHSLVAHSDLYPDYSRSLLEQFDLSSCSDKKVVLEAFNSAHKDYFQSGFMLYDPKIIENDTFAVLLKLLEEFPNSKTNDQGILNLWALPRGLWVNLPTNKINQKYIYDYWEREGIKSNEYIMLKYPRKVSPIKGFVNRVIFEIYWNSKGLLKRN